MRISVLDKIETDIAEYQKANKVTQVDRKPKENKPEDNNNDKKTGPIQKREADIKSNEEIAKKIFTDLKGIELSKSKETTPKAVIDIRTKPAKQSQSSKIIQKH